MENLPEMRGKGRADPPQDRRAYFCRQRVFHPHRNQRWLRKFHCTECGEVKVETIPRTDSGASSSGAGDQTGNQTGNQNGTRTPRKTHRWKTSTVQVTCSAEGKSVRTCTPAVVAQTCPSPANSGGMGPGNGRHHRRYRHGVPPTAPCTRGRVVTFLWQANGSPERSRIPSGTWRPPALSAKPSSIRPGQALCLCAGAVSPVFPPKGGRFHGGDLSP